MSLHKIILAGVLFVSNAAVYAAGWTPYDEVKSLYPNSNGNVYIQLDNYTINHGNEGCVSSGYLVLETGNARFEEIYALSMAAKFTGTNIRYYLSGCSGNYPKLHHAQAN